MRQWKKLPGGRPISYRLEKGGPLHIKHKEDQGTFCGWYIPERTLGVLAYPTCRDCIAVANKTRAASLSPASPSE